MLQAVVRAVLEQRLGRHESATGHFHEMRLKDHCRFYTSKNVRFAFFKYYYNTYIKKIDAMRMQ
jgi:hypothetical protein